MSARQKKFSRFFVVIHDSDYIASIVLFMISLLIYFYLIPQIEFIDLFIGSITTVTIPMLFTIVLCLSSVLMLVLKPYLPKGPNIKKILYGIKKVGILWITVIIYYIFIDKLGFFTTTAICGYFILSFFSSTLMLKKRQVIFLLLVILFIYLFFNLFMNVPFPHGKLF